ncbi:GNAT family N-acetyltransferase [Paenibacillus harenae]|uniref:GNAT family N-acetyltransferase n=1 Tax=Paenibacillus harenae TaxID=306543 RepID=UPI0027D8350B|nr:GNAT family N-acetyltransferase [Paenibacillus harenae]
MDPSDINEAKLLLYNELFEPLGMPRESQEQLKVPGIEHYFVCILNHRIIGVMVLVVSNEIIELHHAAISKEYRGQGIGKKVWQEVLGFCKSEGIKGIELYSRNTAINFWQSVGFTELGEWLEVESFVKHGIRHKKMEISI